LNTHITFEIVLMLFTKKISKLVHTWLKLQLAKVGAFFFETQCRLVCKSSTDADAIAAEIVDTVVLLVMGNKQYVNNSNILFY